MPSSYFDNDLVSSASLRVKSVGIYRDTLSVPFDKEVPDGQATVVITGRNIRFGETRQSQGCMSSAPISTI